MKEIEITLNGRQMTLTVHPDMPLLWVLRDHLKLTGSKYGCGVGVCGACTVHLEGNAVRSCVVPISTCKGMKITTIEGLSETGTHPVQVAWEAHNVPQCGYCQPGQIMSAANLLSKNSHPTSKDIDEHMSGNLCRCGTYPRIKKAILSLSKTAEL